MLFRTLGDERKLIFPKLFIDDTAVADGSELRHNKAPPDRIDTAEDESKDECGRQQNAELTEDGHNHAVDAPAKALEEGRKADADCGDWEMQADYPESMCAGLCERAVFIE